MEEWSQFKNLMEATQQSLLALPVEQQFSYDFDEVLEEVDKILPKDIASNHFFFLDCLNISRL